MRSGFSGATSAPASGGGAGSYFANQPVGYTQFIDESFTVDTPSPWVADYMGFGGVSPTSVSDATAPYSGPKVIRGITHAGTPAGSGPFTYGFDLATPYKNVYYASICKWESTWQNTIGGSGTKHMWLAGDVTQGTGTYVTLNGETDMDLGIVQQGGNPDPTWTYTGDGSTPVDDDHHGREMYANLGNSGKLYSLRGQWLDWEIIQKANSSPTAFDGELHIWIKGIKTHEYPRSAPHGGSSGVNAGVNWLMDAGGIRKWLSFVWNPTFGGSGSDATTDHSHDIDQFRMAGSNT